MEEVITNVLGFIVGFIIMSIVLSIVECLWGLYKHSRNKKRVLQAIKELDIEEALANCVAGCDLRCTIAIEQYFCEHGWGNPFVGAPGSLELYCMIGELRTEGKVKPVYNNLMSMKKKSDGHKNAVMLRKAKEPDIESNLEDYITRWGFREGVDIDMFAITQKRLDELNNIYALTRDVMVTPDNLAKWEHSAKYYVTIRGYVLLVDFSKMREMAIDLECTCGSLYKLIALPESYVNEHLHDNGCQNEVV